MKVFRAVGSSYSDAFERLAKLMYVWEARRVKTWECERSADKVILTVRI